MGRSSKTIAAGRRAHALAGLLAVLAALVGAFLALGTGSAKAVAFSELTIVVTGQGTVRISPPAEGFEECSGTCEELAYPDGTPVKLTPEASGEWTFNGWTGCDAEPSPTECEVVMEVSTPERTVEASFINPPPELPTITFPTENEVIETTGGPVKVEVAFEDSDSTVAEYECDLDATGPPEPCGSPWTIPSVGVGPHTAYVFAIDHGGEGKIVPAMRHFTVAVPQSGGEGGGGSGGGGGNGSPPPPKPETEVLGRWKVAGSRTRVRKLLLEKLPAGAAVRVACKGKGCPFRKKKAPVSGTESNLTGLFRKHALRAGDVVLVRIEAAGSAPQLIEIKLRAGKKPKLVRR